MEVGVEPGDQLCFFPYHRVHAQAWLPVELHERGFSVVVEKPEGVNAESFHHPIRPGDTAVGHVPEGVRGGFGVEGDEIPEGVVCALRLRDLAVGMWFRGMDDVGEFDSVLDEEDRDVVADQVECSFGGVELGGEAASVSDCVGRAA